MPGEQMELETADVQAQQQEQVLARQALRDQQRSRMVAPPDAAVNFSSSVGESV